MPTLKEIYEEINQEVTNDLELGATSTSKVAEFRLLQYVVTSISSVLQGLWNVMETTLINTAKKVPSCNEVWWNAEIRKFQYGHELIIVDVENKKYGYAVKDEDAQIITRVAVVSQPGRGLIKVAKADPAALSVDELAALKSYKNKILPLGSNISIISQDADIIKIPGTVYYDPIIPLSVTQPLVEAAINSYLSSLEFNVGKTGTFYTTYLTDAIQAVDGVVDFIPGQIMAAQDGDALGNIDRKYVPVAGYITIDPVNPLTDTLTYVAES